jgi:hypothetical protein
MSRIIKHASCAALASAILAFATGAAQAQLFGDHWKRPWWGDEERMDRPTADGGATAAQRDYERQYQAYLFGPRCWRETREVRVRGGWAPRVVRVCE